MSFIEGTRFAPEKHDNQNSPYKHLLRPKAGSFAFVLSAMEGHLDDIINITIIYPDGNPGIWHFVSGKMKKVIVHYEVIPVSQELRGDYYQDVEHRKQFQQWVNQAWAEKDQLITETLAKEKS